jgi:hypothetical protein
MAPVSENLLLKECLDAFLKNLEADTTFPQDLTDKLKELRQHNKLTKGDHLKSAVAAYIPKK